MIKTFLLAGNGIFANRGCEAIEAGTIEILRQSFGPSVRIIRAGASIEKNAPFLKALGELQQLPFMEKMPRFSRPWFEYQLNRKLGTSFPGIFQHLAEPIVMADAVLCLGGDHYSLDYGYPERFIQFDRFVMKLKKPVIYFGHSVGPFTKDALYENRIKKHLRRISLICARESATVAYLESLDVNHNVFLVADPAFAMKCKKPEAFLLELDEGSFIAANFSKTAAAKMFDGKMLSARELEHIVKKYAEIGATLIKMNLGKLVFIPHVTGGENCDYVFMKVIRDKMVQMGLDAPLLVPDNLSAAEYKWIISQARMFIGARTHSTIASFSSGVPTISIAYSIKAKGITADMYGEPGFCIDGKDMCPEAVSETVRHLIGRESYYRERLRRSAQEMIRNAFRGGNRLRKLIADAC